MHPVTRPFHISAAILAAAGVAAAAPAIAEPARPAPAGHAAATGGERTPDAGPGPGERRGPGGHPSRHGGVPGLPFLRGLDLSEAQQDRLFAILHAEAPQLREQDKIEDKAHAALRAMADSGEVDEARASRHAAALGQAVAARAMLRLRTAGQVMALLTPEQRARIQYDDPRDPRAPRG